MNLRRIVTAALFAPIACVGASQIKSWPAMAPAPLVANASAASTLAAARAGDRVVAVGDHGVILLSDDGAHFRQAKSVPVRSMLTTVQFVDAHRGFAGGHDGVVLATQDAGENWTLLRSTPGVEQPVLSLHFDSPDHGIAVGLYGWAIETSDAGRTWSERKIADEGDDRHLFHVFISAKGTWLIAGEQGSIFRSNDGGKSWQAIKTDDEGSLWHGASLADGSLLVCGMRGHIYRSDDDGLSWKPVESGTMQSLTGIAQLKDGSVLIVGMSGTILRSKDSGLTFSSTQREQGEPLTDVLANGDQPLLFSMLGPVP